MQQKSILSLAKEIRFEGYVLVRMSEQRTGSNGAKYLDLTLADCTGELNGKVWDGTDPAAYARSFALHAMSANTPLLARR